jgi:hypothetical protein
MKYLALAFILILSACVNDVTKESKVAKLANISEQPNIDNHLLLLSLLKIDTGEFTYIDENGVQQADELKQFKAIENIYIRNIGSDPSIFEMNSDRLKTIMFFSFYSLNTNSAAFMEYLAADLMPIYNKNKIYFLKTLNTLPFLVNANCNRLNAYFGFEGRNNNQKNIFLENNMKLFKDYLGDKQLKLCLAEF